MKKHMVRLLLLAGLFVASSASAMIQDIEDAIPAAQRCPDLDNLFKQANGNINTLVNSQITTCSSNLLTCLVNCIGANVASNDQKKANKVITAVSILVKKGAKLTQETNLKGYLNKDLAKKVESLLK